MNNPLLLELSAWPWLERLSVIERRYVTLENVPPSEWDRVAGEGFDLVFLMGVWSRSAIGRELALTDAALGREYDRILPGWTAADVAGSAYSIQRYEPDRRIGGWVGLEKARRELKARGLQLILDFVPNHTGFDHPWVAHHPHRFVLGTPEDVDAAPEDFRMIASREGPVHVACGRDPHFAPWRDVAQLNYFNPDTRDAMRGVLRELAGHCDGVRCDMAMLVLNDVFEGTWRRVLHGEWPRPVQEFWPGATRAVPQLMYLAEVYWDLEGVLLDQGFTYAYDKRLLDALHAPDSGRRVRQLLAGDNPEGGRLARFIENHDEPRSAESLAGRLPAAAALTTTLPGMRFLFDGQQDGRKVRSPVQLARWPDEPADVVVRGMYERVLRYASAEVLRDGEWRLLEVGSAGDDTFRAVVAYRWRMRAALAVVVVNLGTTAAQANIALAGDLPDGIGFDFADALTGATYASSMESLEGSGLYIRLEAGGAHLFTAAISSQPSALSSESTT